MSECVTLTASAKIPGEKRIKEEKPLIQKRIKEEKLTKQCFFLLPHWFSAQGSECQYRIASKYSILTIIEL